jgi:7,8-dihydropterin-6-yl-methyl-4-(beta-D-ribofuranosyl)aminobenzene 5'-phosphate synthase
MKISVLIENKAEISGLQARHGLALLVKTDEHVILFDTGPDEAFTANARQLGVDLSDVELVVISHGHYDHGGGLPAFCRLNSSAPIYLHSKAVKDSHFSLKPGNIYRDAGFIPEGCEQRLMYVDEQFTKTGGGVFSPVDGVLLFAGFPKDGFIPEGNRLLYSQKPGGVLEADDFSHEIAMLVLCGNALVLITGCSHSGIGNMVRRANELTGGRKIDAVVGGFHLMYSDPGSMGKKNQIETVAEELRKFPETKFYTGHCTGEEAFAQLRKLLGDQIAAIETGSCIQL